MKLFIDGRWLTTPQHGVATYILDLVRGIIAAKKSGRVKNLAICLGIETERAVPQDLRDENVQILVMGTRGWLWRAFVLPFVLHRENVDVAHFQYVCPFIKLNARYITTIHDLLFLRYGSLFSYKYKAVRTPTFWLAAKISDLVLTVSDSSSRDITTYFGRTKQLITIPIGLSRRFRQFGWAAENSQDMPVEAQKYILAVGRVERRKNYVRLCRAYEKSNLRNQGMALAVVGWCDATAKEEVNSLQSTPGVIWLQDVSDEKLHWLYTHAAAFIFPSICEGYGIPLIEALDAGLACATSENFPLDDIKAVCATSFDPYREDEIAEALNALAKRPLPNANVAKVLERYSWTSFIEKYLSALAELSHRGSAPVP